MLLLAMLPHPVVVSPDAVEMAAAGKCLWQAPLVAEACAGLEPWFWPPAFPLLAGLPVLLGVDPAVSVTAASLLCWALLVLPLGALAERLAPAGEGWAAALVAPALIAVPMLPVELMMSDARSLSLLTTFSAAALLLTRPPTRRRAVGVGLLLAVACLARPEALLPVACLLLLAILSARSLAAPLTTAAVVLPYMGLLSAQAGQVVLTSRSWQKGVHSWLTLLPDEWVKHELAAGSWGTPLRSVLSTTPMPASAPPTVDPGQIAIWLHVVFLESLPVLLYLGAAWGLVVALRARRLAGLLVLGAVGLPCLVVMLMPQAQDHLLPLNNLQPLLVSLVVLTAAALAGLLRRLGARRRHAGLALAGLLVAASLRPQPADFGAPIAFEAAVDWLASDTPPETSVSASLVSAAIPLRASRLRHHLPAPWSIPAWVGSPARTDLLVVSSLDLPGSSRAIRTLAGMDALTPVVEFVEADGWVVIFAIDPDAGSD